MRRLDRVCHFLLALSLLMFVISFIYQPTLVVSKTFDAAAIEADSKTQREFVVRNIAPWPIRILGGNFG